MMQPNEYALYLYNLYYNLIKDFTRGVSIKELAKECALKAVDEIIKSNPHNDLFKLSDIPTSMNYWEQVKQELKKL
jgi:hypothetical protein